MKRSVFALSSLCVFVSNLALSKNLEVTLNGFVTPRSTQSEIAEGIKALYSGSISNADLDTQTYKASQFQNLVYTTLEKYLQDGRRLKVETKQKRLAGNFVLETTLRFPSLIQRPGSHKANTVVAKIYQSTTSLSNCDYKYPATIFLHHIKDELDMIEDASAVMAAGVLNQSAVFAVLHLPHYGERKEPGEEFLTPNLGQFRLNMAQLVLDTHALRQVVASLPIVNADQISLSGISLGGVLGLTVGAFDQGFTSYATLVGGGNLANILSNRAQNRPESEVALALKGSVIDEDYLRSELAAVDPIVWGHRMKSREVFMLNASRDDIVNYQKSVEPVFNVFETNYTQIRKVLVDDEHSPTGSGFKKLKTVFFPMLKFITQKSPTIHEACPQQY